jgi:predicted DNA binding protein
MALVAEFTTPTETFAAGRAFDDCPVSRVELERIVPTEATVVPYLWVWGDDHREYETRLAAEPGVTDVQRLDVQDDCGLCRVEWSNDRATVVWELFDLEFTLLSGVCIADGWTFEVRFPSNDAAAVFQRQLAASGIPHDLTKVSTQVASHSGEQYGLTTEQREVLAAAARSGYFEEPRDATLADLADELDISLSAASGRLRRASATLVHNTIFGGPAAPRPAHHE